MPKPEFPTDPLILWCADRPTIGIYVCLMGLLVFLAFRSLAGHPLNNNDSDYFELGAAAWQTPSVLLKPHASLPFRPLASLVFVGVQPIFGTDPARYHVLVIGLHLFASLLLAFTAFRLGFSLEISLLSGLLFLLDAAHLQPVQWIALLGYILETIFGLVTCVAFHAYLNTQQVKHLCLTGAALIAAILSHFTGVVLLPFCYYLAWHKTRSLKQALVINWPLILITLLCGVLAYLFYPTLSPRETLPIAVVYDFFQYFFRSLNKMLILAHGMFSSTMPAKLELLLGLVACTGMIYLALHQRVLLPWMVWTLLHLAPFLIVLSIVPMAKDEPWPSRYYYTASAGTALVSAWLLWRLSERIAAWAGMFWGRATFTGLSIFLAVSSLFAIHSNEALALYSSGRYYIALGDVKTGGRLIARGFSKDADIMPFDAYLRMVSGAFSEGKSHLPILEDGLKRYPNNPQLLLLTGVAASLHDNHFINETGNKRITKAFELADGKPQIFFDASLILLNLATHYQQIGDVQKAIDICQKVLEFRPNYVLALLNLGQAQLVQGKTQEGLQAYFKAVRLDPERAAPLVGIANRFYIEGQHQTAMDIYETLAKTIPETSHGQYSRGLALFMQGKYVESIEAFEKSSEQAPQDMKIQMSLAMTYEKVGKIPQAIQAYQHLLSFRPNHLEAQRRLAALE